MLPDNAEGIVGVNTRSEATSERSNPKLAKASASEEQSDVLINGCCMEYGERTGAPGVELWALTTS